MLISSMVTGFVQLCGQICQFLGMGSIVTCHILHQCLQFVHRGMLALGSAIMAVTAAVMAVGMLCAFGMEMLVVVGMNMVMLMGMGMGVAVGNAVVGVLVGMGMLVVMDMTAGYMVVMNVHIFDSFNGIFSILYPETEMLSIVEEQKNTAA